MRTIAVLCSLVLGPLVGLPGCLEAQPGAHGGDAKGATGPLATTPPPDTSATTPPADTHVATHPPDTTPPDTAAPDTTAPETTPECLAANAECQDGGACCDGLVCIWQPDHYMLALCAAPRANGQPCMDDTSCQSGHCFDSVCADAPACSSESVHCSYQGQCCAGLVCTGGPYIDGECIHKQPLRAYCEGDRWCESGLCQDGACVNPGCLANGAHCGGGECCSGLCRFPPDSYGPLTCIAPLPEGSWCDGDAMCASGVCTDSLCAARSCGALGDQCYYDGGCCAGAFCTNPGDSYTAGKCLGKRADGGYCQLDSWCRSGHCVDGTCAPAP